MNPKHYRSLDMDPAAAEAARAACTTEFAPPDVSVFERADEAKTLGQRQRILLEKPLDAVANRACVTPQRLREIESGAQPSANEAANLGKALAIPGEFIAKKNDADGRRALRMKVIY